MGNDSGSDILKTVGSIFITLLIVGAVVGLVMAGIGLFNQAGDKMTNTATSIMETEYTQYDGASPSGSSVVNLIQQKKSGDDNIYILVKTKMNTSGVYYICDANNVKLDADTMRALVKDMKTNTSSNYINPSKKFYGEVIRNDNNAIVGIVFTQE